MSIGETNALFVATLPIRPEYGNAARRPPWRRRYIILMIELHASPRPQVNARVVSLNLFLRVCFGAMRLMFFYRFSRY